MGAGPVTSHADTESIDLHLAKISEGISPDADAALMIDGAGWHVSDKRVVGSNITLVRMTLGEPELNPIENVLDHVRGTKLVHRPLYLTATS